MTNQEPKITCGLEIHQQLDTNKLFCSCSSAVRDDEPHFTVTRALRASAGETGEVDAAAAHEQKKAKSFIYQGYHDATCLVETDEEPPHPLNQEALQTVLTLAKLMHCHILDTIIVMRKTVVDGSNTSGFQRTALVATDGWIEVAGNSIRIPTVCIEEDAARQISANAHVVTYRLDRLGVPLIEIATGPDIHDAEQAKEVAGYIGMLLRSTGKVKRGLGTIRQDVNISIADGARVEIKGAQDLRLIPTIVNFEAQRQQQLLSIFSELKKRKAQAHDTIHDVTRIFEMTQSKLVARTLKGGGAVLGIRLEGFHGLLGMEIQVGRRFGTELSDYAKMRGVLGLIHSDEDLTKYSLSEEEIGQVREELGVGAQDAFVLIADAPEKAAQALQEVVGRARRLALPKEVRKANEDGTSSFLRPMPGAARMYPETDIPAIVPDLTHIVLPELIEQKIGRFEKQYGLSKDLAQEMAKNHSRFEEFAHRYANVKAIIIARYLSSAGSDVKATFGVEMDALDVEMHADELLGLLDAGRIAKEALVELLGAKARGEHIDASRFMAVDDADLKQGLQDIIAKNPAASVQALMGEAMKQYRGKIDGKKIMNLLQELAGKR